MKVYWNITFALLFILVNYTDSYIMSIINSRNKNIVRNKKGIEYRKFSNENEKYLYANYLVSLRKIKKAQRAFNNLVIESNRSNDSNESNDSNRSNESNELVLNIENKTILDNNQKIAKNLILANIRIDVSNVKYIQISTKNDTIVVELDKKNEYGKNNENNFINYDLGKLDSLISAISILMNLLNIH